MFREEKFRDFLCAEQSITSENGVNTRMTKARKAESLLGKELDSIVSNDDAMFEALMSLRTCEDPAHTPMQNAVRKYYKFCNGREFPRLRDYHSPMHP